MDLLVTHEQLRNLVMQLPVAKLPKAYSILSDLIKSPTDPLPTQTIPTQEESFNPLLEEKRHILKEQAKTMVAYYEETEDERDEWQAGDFGES